jgi:hypothetical protein
MASPAAGKDELDSCDGLNRLAGARRGNRRTPEPRPPAPVCKMARLPVITGSRIW